MNNNNRNSFGLTERDVNTINSVFKKYPELMLVHIFGSRAKGNYLDGSDIDLAIMNDDISEQTMRCIRNDFAESSLPYNVDILLFKTLQHAELRKHIERAGIVIYKAAEIPQLL